MDQLLGPDPSAAEAPAPGTGPQPPATASGHGGLRGSNPPGLLGDLRRRAPELRDAVLRHPGLRTATARVAEWTTARPSRPGPDVRPGSAAGSGARLAAVLAFRPGPSRPDGPPDRPAAQIVDLARYRARRLVDPRSAS